jgi:hypothetical protein
MTAAAACFVVVLAPNFDWHPWRQRCTSPWAIGAPVMAQSATSLASGSSADVRWHLIDRACFQAVSAHSRSRWLSCPCGGRD